MAQKKKLLSVDDLWRVERIGALSLSPDGAQAVCSVTRFEMDENKGVSTLWLLSTLGGEPRRLTSGGEKDGQPAWSPAGDRIAFLGRREQEGRKDDTPQLYVIAPDGGEARRVSDFAPGIDAFKWFPDGKRIAFVAWVWPDAKGPKAQAKRFKAFKDRKETAYVTSEAQYRYWDRNLPMGRVAHLHVLDVATGRVRDLFEGTDFELSRADPDANGFDISPDGTRVVFAFDPHPVKQLDHCKALAELHLRSGKSRRVAVDAAWDFEAPCYSPGGKQIACLASHQGLKHTMPAHLALVTPGDAWRPLSADWDHSVHAPLKWAADGASLFFTAEDRARCHLYRWDIEAADAAVAAPGGWVQGFDVAGDVIATAADAMSHPVRVHARHGDAPPRRIESFNDALLAKCRLGEVEDVTLGGAQGDPVQMWLVYPPGFDRKKKYPLLHCIHGGPHAASGDTFHYRWNNQVFAAQGYVVACVNYHGSSGFGHAFLDSITHRWGELELQDVEAGTDWLRRKAWIDKKRVFATGGSYGGFMVAWMNGHVPPGRYNAYVCHAGCFDWTAMFSDDAYTWHPRELGGWYWEAPEKIAAQSPHTHAKAMQTPTLVMHGALDYRVPDQQGLAYYNTLKAKGVDARLVWFPDENHWVLKPRNSKLWYGEFFDWLKRHA
ncbi:S9 family peptidase [Piscinibacter sp.]|uniref:S9 family peptidase n=1 Tax=Piscinibacter sp. TaxID=1903157 RepID=UPI002C0BA4DA|nr:S9 family peptidase [Albitalea sp.]HUG21272.1 S9 family peptidase [Albitalea sp.]